MHETHTLVCCHNFSRLTDAVIQIKTACTGFGLFRCLRTFWVFGESGPLSLAVGSVILPQRSRSRTLHADLNSRLRERLAPLLS